MSVTPDLECAKKTEELLEVIAAPGEVVGSVEAFLEAYGLKPGRVLGVRSRDLYRLYRQWTAETGVWWEQPRWFGMGLTRSGFKTTRPSWAGPRWLAVSKASAVRVLAWVGGNPEPLGFGEWYREQVMPSRRKDE